MLCNQPQAGLYLTTFTAHFDLVKCKYQGFHHKEMLLPRISNSANNTQVLKHIFGKNITAYL
jgi:hypothetical protein